MENQSPTTLLNKRPLNANEQKQMEAENNMIAREDEEERVRKGRAQALLDTGIHKPIRPDSDWTPPSPNTTASPNARGVPGVPAYLPRPDPDIKKTQFHPNSQSSGRIEAQPRKHQYSGQPGSPRNDPGFLQYSK